MIFFRKKSTPKVEPTPEPASKPVPETKPGCTHCRSLKKGKISGGSRTLHFVTGEEVKVEILDERAVGNRRCFTLNVLNDPQIGWADVPIKYCPYCARKLR